MRAKVGDLVEARTVTGSSLVKGKVVTVEASGYRLADGKYAPEARLVSVNGKRVGDGSDPRAEKLPKTGKEYMKRWAAEEDD